MFLLHQAANGTAETPVEEYIESVTKAEEGVVSCVRDRMHGLTDGDRVTFREVEGMTELNAGKLKS